MKLKKTYLVLTGLFLINSCVQDDDFTVPSVVAEDIEEPVLAGTQTSFRAIKQRFEGSRGIATFTEDEDIYIEGYVVSSDETGNFFKELIIQNKTDASSDPQDPRMGFRIDIDQAGLFSKYGQGRKVYVLLAGLSITRDNGVLAIGKLINGEFDKIQSVDLNDIVIRSPQVAQITPKTTTIDQLNEDDLNTLISLENIQFTNSELGKTYAGEASDEFDGERLLESCEDADNIILSTSTFSDFVSEVIPQGTGVLTAVYSRDFFDTKDVLLVRDANDVVLDGSRCDLSELIETNMTMDQLIDRFSGEIVDLGIDDRVVEGYVVSSDQEKNFSGVLVLQDSVANPTSGIQIMTEDENLFHNFPLGTKVLLKLNGLALGKNKEGILSLGHVDNGKINAVPQGELDRFLINTEEMFKMEPLSVSIDDFDDIPASTLVSLTNMEVVTGQLGAAFAFFSGTDSASRTLIDCDAIATIDLKNSGGSTFANEAFPAGNGTITAVLNKDDEGNYLIIRNEGDIDFANPYQDCTPPSASTAIIFSELADPNNNEPARFIELYNASDIAVDISAWKIRRYTNESLAISNELQLEGFILAGETYVISPNAAAFEAVYGFPPDFAPTNGIVADSNGDDNFELVDINGTIIDVFGVVGEDGTGTNHEFEDGRALRIPSVVLGNTDYTFSEWQVWNDTGLAGTILLPQDAPGSFTPGIR